jgi:hypothetical protein
MSPSAIVETLQHKNIQFAALTDHNTTLNCPAFANLCKKAGIIALYGMELQTVEEIHILCLFSNLQTAMDFGTEIYNLIPFFPNNPKINGDQVYVDENENILGEIEKYLIVSADLSIDKAAARVHQLGGICIPAHVNRAAFSMTSQLGFIPTGDWDALEVTSIPPMYTMPGKNNKTIRLNTQGYPLTTSSDAHYLEDIGKRPFDLDIQESQLLKTDNTVDLDIVKASLQRRPK